MTYKTATALTGRFDGNSPELLRWHQVIEYIDLSTQELAGNSEHKPVVFLEFRVDEGVRRNQGRVGASEGSQTITKALANFPVHHQSQIFHGGIITCDDGNLEKSQEELAFYVSKILAKGGLPMVFGGGHEVTYGHYQGIKNLLPSSKIGIINIDAHFDIRPIVDNIGATSGTSIWQIAHEAKENHESFKCLTLGLQRYSNTKLLFNLADEFGVKYVMGDDFNYDSMPRVLSKIESFITTVDHLYLTVCMDVFAAAYAPGVSAPSFNGLVPDHVFMSCFDLIVKSPKLISLDFAEVNPKFDIDSRTAKLAAALVFRTVV